MHDEPIAAEDSRWVQGFFGVHFLRRLAKNMPGKYCLLLSYRKKAGILEGMGDERLSVGENKPRPPFQGRYFSRPRQRSVHKQNQDKGEQYPTCALARGLRFLVFC